MCDIEARLRRRRFRGATTASVIDGAGDDGGQVPTRASFVDCDWQPGKPHVTFAPGAPRGAVITEVTGVETARHTT